MFLWYPLGGGAVAITLTYEVMTPVAAVIIGSYDSISPV